MAKRRKREDGVKGDSRDSQAYSWVYVPSPQEYLPGWHLHAVWQQSKPGELVIIIDMKKPTFCSPRRSRITLRALANFDSASSLSCSITAFAAIAVPSCCTSRSFSSIKVETRRDVQDLSASCARRLSFSCSSVRTVCVNRS